MKIVVAPDSFKGSLSAENVCKIIETSAKKWMPKVQVLTLPISDGGEGMVESLLSALGGEKITKSVSNPLGNKIEAEYGILADKTAVIEMAAASGLPLIKNEERNPMETTTYGTGELIEDALCRGCQTIILGIGGSATTDGGIGAATALGMRFLDISGQDVSLSGKGLSEIQKIDTSGMSEKLKKAKVIIACDVDNPLCGPLGSAAIYGPQKGADDKMIQMLDVGLEHLESIVEKETGQSLKKMPGIGAAGGVALPFVAFWGAELKPGLEIVLDILKFDEKIKGADLVITGEGKTDEQSAMGKVLSGVSKRSKAKNVPVVALSGALGEGFEVLYNQGLTAAFGTWKSGASLEDQMKYASKHLKETADNLFRLICALR